MSTSTSTTPSRTESLIPGPLLSVVVLSYGRPQFLSEVLTSIVSQVSPDTEILLVDNASQASEEIARLAAGFPSVTLIRNPANLGFCGGMNVGITAARGGYIYLTEDDVVLRPGCIDALLSHVRQHPDVGLAAPIMYNKRSGTIRSAGGRFSLGAVYVMKIAGENETDRGQFDKPFDVTYIPGASILASAALLKSLKGFREDFFVYYEDAELCMRVLKAGKRIVTVPDAKIEHFEPPSGPSSDFVDFCRIRNFFAVYLLHAPLGVLPVFLARYAGLEMLRAIARDRRRAKLLFQALCAIAADAPGLLSQRDDRRLPTDVD